MIIEEKEWKNKTEFETRALDDHADTVTWIQVKDGQKHTLTHTTYIAMDGKNVTTYTTCSSSGLLYCH